MSFRTSELKFGFMRRLQRRKLRRKDLKVSPIFRPGLRLLRGYSEGHRPKQQSAFLLHYAPFWIPWYYKLSLLWCQDRCSNLHTDSVSAHQCRWWGHSLPHKSFFAKCTVLIPWWVMTCSLNLKWSLLISYRLALQHAHCYQLWILRNFAAQMLLSDRITTPQPQSARKVCSACFLNPHTSSQKFLRCWRR